MRRGNQADRRKLRMLIGLTVGFGMSLCALEYGKPLQGLEEYQWTGMDEDWMEVEHIPVTRRLPDPPKTKKVPPKVIAVANTAPRVVPNNSVIEQGELPDFVLPDEVYFAPDIVENPVIDPMDFPETWPEFPGGDAELLKYLKDNLRYPKFAKEMGIEGIVIVKFVVDADGEVDPKSIEFLRKVHPSLNEEAVRVIKQMPKWKPGRQKLRNVPVYMKLPIKFRLG